MERSLMSSRSASDISDVKKSWLVSGADALSSQP